MDAVLTPGGGCRQTCILRASFVVSRVSSSGSRVYIIADNSVSVDECTTVEKITTAQQLWLILLTECSLWQSDSLHSKWTVFIMIFHIYTLSKSHDLSN
jgi:hypothetical protein